MRSINSIFLFISILFFAGSCIKEVDYNEGIVNNEKSTIRLPLAPEELIVYAFDAVPGDVDLTVLEIRRDVISNADLNQTVVAKIALDTNHLKQYNIDNKTNYVVFKDYTLTSTAETPFDGNNWTATFGPGEVVKYIKIRFDPSKMDFSKQNALAFTVTAAAPHEISNHRSLITEILAKNKYDGVYRITGTMNDAANATLSGYFPQDVELITTGAKTVEMIPLDLGIPGHLIYSGPDVSYYGSFGPVFKFDDNDNVIEVVNYYGQPASNGRSARLDPTGVNKWDPASKSITVKYQMLQPGTTVRTSFDEVFQYLGPR